MIRKVFVGIRVCYTSEVFAQVCANNPGFDGVGTIVGIEYLNPTPSAIRRGMKRETLARVKWDRPVIGNVEFGTARYETVEPKSHLNRV